MHLRCVAGVKRLNHGRFAVQKLACHAGLAHRDSHGTLQFLADIAWFDIAGLLYDDVLAAVVVGGAFAEIFSLLDGSLVVALVQILNYVRVQVLNLFLDL